MDDEEKPILWGDYNSQKARRLEISFEMCEGKDYCEDKDVILDWLTRKFILILYNKKRFETTNFHENALVSEAKLEWIKVNS